MLSDAKVSAILQLKGGNFSTQFIRDFDCEWDVVTKQLKDCKVDLGKIALVLKKGKK